MRTITWTLMILLGLAVVLAAGCGKKEADHDGMAMGGKAISTDNLDVAVFGKGDEAKYCPVMGSPIPAGKGLVHTMKDGKRIKLCCGACVAAVEKDPEKYKGFFY